MIIKKSQPSHWFSGLEQSSQLTRGGDGDKRKSELNLALLGDKVGARETVATKEIQGKSI